MFFFAYKGDCALPARNPICTHKHILTPVQPNFQLYCNPTHLYAYFCFKEFKWDRVRANFKLCSMCFMSVFVGHVRSEFPGVQVSLAGIGSFWAHRLKPFFIYRKLHLEWPPLSVQRAGGGGGQCRSQLESKEWVGLHTYLMCAFTLYSHHENHIFSLKEDMFSHLQYLNN